ncbi:MAG TPA: DUF2442 domain-containing protein [Anaeromyxobacteraceae bacterium]|nr:DUF2442 domain-containing protein [Anaeromyxobacteraceae bacterium]
MTLVDVTSVSPIGGFVVELTFDDGTVRQVDLEPYLRGPVFEPVRRDPAYFQSVRVDPELGTIVWPNGADIDPQVLRYGLRLASWPEP